MRRIVRKRQLFVVTLVVITLIVVVYINNFNGLIKAFSDSAAATQADLNSRISTSTYFIESMRTMGNKYFVNGGASKDSEYIGLLNYDAVANEYNMDGVNEDAFAAEVGNLTGMGEIPQSGIDRQELNLALSFNDYFSSFYKRLPEIAWMYYTSESGFINMYPWVSSEEFKYSDKLKSVPFYSIATPEYDISRKTVWTPVYLDAAGKGPMVTLSSPIYFGDDFKGVLSLDFTTKELGRILNSSFKVYLVDDEYAVISASGLVLSDSEISHLKHDYGFSDTELQTIVNAEYGSAKPAGNYYIFKATVADAPWTLLFMASKLSVIGKSLLLTLPEIMIGILLVFSFIVLISFRKAEQQLNEASLTDPLTGLKNRRYLDAATEKEIALADRNAQALSLISLDLDRFKKINDTWGHPIGDEVLKLTANILKNSMRSSDVLVRLGGEEFAILLPQTGIAQAYEAAERARKAMEDTRYPIAGTVTASFGVAERQPGESYSSLYRRADEALYCAKDLGRNQVVSYGENANRVSVNVKIEWNSAWECGEAKIDFQHRELLRLANTLLGMIHEKPEDFSEQLDSMIKHISEHFSYEEGVQEDIGYPQAEAHAAMHRELTEKALKIKEDCLAGIVKSASLISFILDDVIILHLLEEDTKFFPYIKKSS